MRKKYFQAIAVMVGYVIGVGMFGLPFLISRAGLLAFFVLLVVLSLAQYLIHLIYANLILVTNGYHRLPGYVGIYFGKKGKNLVFIAKLIGSYGALLAYIIITGIFLNQLLSPLMGGSEFIYATILFALEALVVFFGIGMVARVELFMTAFLLLAVMMITWRGWGAINLDNYTLVSWPLFFIPYGAMLYALDGSGALPLVAKILNKKREDMKKVVRIGTFLPALVIMVFVLVIVGISGGQTTPDALVGVSGILKDGVILFALIFGVLTMITSFFGVAEAIKETLWWDFKMNKHWSWALAVFVPYALYLLGFKNLINVIGFSGAVAGGFCAIMLMLVFLKLKKSRTELALFNYKPGKLISYFLLGLFVAGIIYEIYYFINL